MKRFYKLFTLAALVLWAGCTNETEVTVPEPAPEPVTPITEREVTLDLQNDLKLSSVATRAIATAEENEISSLDVYVFGALEEDGNYTYQERFSYRANGTVVPGSTAISLDATGQPTALLRPKKGLFVKFYCVANQPDLYELDNVTDPTTPKYKLYDTFTSLVQSAPGQDNNTVIDGVPTEDKFKELVTRIIDPKVKNDTIVPTLPMSGAYATTLDLKDFSLVSRLRIGVKLTRVVARFDVQNNPETTKLTIDSIAMDNGRPTTTMFPVEPKGTAANGLITYPGRHYWGADAAGLRKSAFYTYSSPRNDNGALVLIGKYAINKTETVDVRYRIPFTQVKDGTGAYVEINHNHRYTVEVTDANEHEVKVNITVNDWADSGNIDDYTPENGMKDLDITELPDKSKYDAATKTVTMSVAPGSLGEFTVETGANADIDCQATYAEKGAEWLEIEKTTPTPSTRAWTMPATFTVKVKSGYTGKYPKATLRFVNTASSDARIIYVVPEAAPVIDIAESTPADPTDNPNEITGDPASPTVSLYNLTDNKSIFSLAVSCPDGVVVDETAPIPDWLTVAPKELTSVNDKITITVVSNKLPANGTLPTYTLKIKNRSNGNLAVTVPVEIKDATPEVTGFSASNTTGWVAPDPASGTAGELAVVENNTMTVGGIKTFNGAKVEISYGAGGGWLVAGTPAAEATTRVVAEKKEKIIFSLKEGVAVTGEATVKITDKNLNTPALTFKVKPILSAPTVAVSTTAPSPTQNSYDAASKILTMYRLPSASSTLSIKATALGGTIVGLPTFAGLSVLPSAGDYAKDREYAFTVAQGTAFSNSLTVNVKNNSDNTKSTALTLNVLDPKITKVEKDATSTTEEALDVMDGDKLTFTMTVGKTFVLKVSSPKGVKPELASNNWCTVSDGGFSNGTQLITLKCTATTGSADVKLTLKNNITGGGDKIITIVPCSGVPLYNGKTPNLLAIPGKTAYYVAPEDVKSSVKWTDVNFSTVCPEGWHVPTKDEFMAMTGITTTGSYDKTNLAAISAAFPAGYRYWSSTDYDASYAWNLGVNSSSGAYVNSSGKTSSYQVRCVKAK